MVLNRRYTYLLLPLLLLLSGQARAQLKASARCTADSIEVGDQFLLFIEAEAPKGTLVHWPEISGWDALEIIEAEKTDSFVDERKVIYQQKIRLSAFDSGTLWIPPIDIEWVDASGNARIATTDSIGVYVNLVHVDDNAELRANAEPIEPKEWWQYWPWYLAALGVILMSLVLYLLIKHFRRKRAANVTASQTLEERSLAALMALQSMQVNDEDDLKVFYSQLIDIVKTYLSRKSGLALTESTTDEILQLAPEHQILNRVSEELGKLLHIADLAKFAKAIPGQDIREQNIQLARSIIERTKVEQQEGSSK